jgi:hypothetical protein
LTIASQKPWKPGRYLTHTEARTCTVTPAYLTSADKVSDPSLKTALNLSPTAVGKAAAIEMQVEALLKVLNKGTVFT